ncbi:hypothetical protein Tco_0857481 [Tanacetum coccineum]|uniref:Uncharacterized protein n=1 Tax=Tanacetum coccineum TaxID=301880 RepID=A0ABQ5BAL7_9ASTR
MPAVPLFSRIASGFWNDAPVPCSTLHHWPQHGIPYALWHRLTVVFSWIPALTVFSRFCLGIVVFRPLWSAMSCLEAAIHVSVDCICYWPAFTWASSVLLPVPAWMESVSLCSGSPVTPPIFVWHAIVTVLLVPWMCWMVGLGHSVILPGVDPSCYVFSYPAACAPLSPGTARSLLCAWSLSVVSLYWNFVCSPVCFLDTSFLVVGNWGSSLLLLNGFRNRLPGNILVPSLTQCAP